MPLDVANIFGHRLESIDFARGNQGGREKRVITNVCSDVVKNTVPFDFSGDKTLHLGFINPQPESVALRPNHPFLAAKRALKDRKNPAPRQNSEGRTGDSSQECGSWRRREPNQLC